MASIEIVAAVFAAISATKDTIDLWRQAREPEAVRARFHENRERLIVFGEAKNAAADITDLLPDYITDIFVDRVEQCMQRFAQVLQGEFLPGEMDEASENVGRCVCRELRRIKIANGGVLPSRWNEQWVRYGCEAYPGSQIKY